MGISISFCSYGVMGWWHVWHVATNIMFRGTKRSFLGPVDRPSELGWLWKNGTKKVRQRWRPRGCRFTMAPWSSKRSVTNFFCLMGSFYKNNVGKPIMSLPLGDGDFGHCLWHWVYDFKLRLGGRPAKNRLSKPMVWLFGVCHWGWIVWIYKTYAQDIWYTNCLIYFS